MGVLAAAVAFARMSAAGAIAAAVFGASALFFAESLVRSLDGGERASFESAWGGLGGGLGGWRLTAPLVYLIATAVFATLLLVVAVHEMSPVDQAGTEAVGAGEAGAGEAGAGEGDVDESEELVLLAMGDDGYAFQFDPYGRRLGLPLPAADAKAAHEKAAAEAAAGLGEGEGEVAVGVARGLGEEEEEEEEGDAGASKRAPKRRRKTIAIRSETDAGVLREEARSAVDLARRMDGFVYDLVGMNLSTLAAIHVLSAVPPWTNVEEAIGRLGPYLDDGMDDPALAKDASLVTKAVDDLKRRSPLLAATLVYGTALAQAVDSPHETERRTRGLTALSEGLRFQDRRSRTVLQRELERYRETVSGAYEDHADWPSLMDVDFAQWRNWVAAAVKSRTSPYEPSRVRLASESAWRSWKERLEKRAITGRVDIEVTEADLFCQVGGVPPATELRTDLEKMTVRDWTTAFLRGCGFRTYLPDVELLTMMELDDRPRAWFAASALIELGLANRVESVLSGVREFNVDHVTKDVEEVRSWLRRIEQTRPRALQPRQVAVILSGGEELPVSAGWSPSGRFGALSLSMTTVSTADTVLTWLGIGAGFAPVWMIELPADYIMTDEVEGFLRMILDRPIPRSHMFFLTGGKGLPALPSALAYLGVAIDGPENLDQAMEEALRVLKRPS